MINKVILTVLLIASSLTALAQTPMVDYRPTRHYHYRVLLFHKLPMITTENIVMLGNSLVEFGGDWNERLPQAHGLIVNRGIKGDDADGMLRRLEQITPFKPRKIFVGCGINDLSHKLSNDEVIDRVQKLLAEIHKQSPESKIYYFSLLPINERLGRWKSLEGRTDDIPKINSEMEKWCNAHGISYIDLFYLMKEEKTNTLRKELTVDGLHLTELGYDIWANKLKELVTVID